jgi:hypothetical protein
MGKVYDVITPELAEWPGRQRVFFVATAPRAEDGARAILRVRTSENQ